MAADEWSAEHAIAAAVPRTFRGTVWRIRWRAVQPIDWSLSLRTSGRYHRGLDLFPAKSLLVPSAALPGLNLVLLPANLPNPLPVQVVRQTELPIELLEQAPRADLSDEQPE